MLDLYTIPEMFAALEGCLQPRGDGESFDLGTEFRKVLDPHVEADAWLAAEPEERSRLGAVAAEKLSRVVAHLGKSSRCSRLSYEERHRSERSLAQRQRRARARGPCRKPVALTPEERQAKKNAKAKAYYQANRKIRLAKANARNHALRAAKVT